MNLMQILLDAGNQSSMKELGNRFGLDESATRGVVEQVSPLLGRSLKQQTARPEGMEALGRALSSGQHQRYLDRPESLRDDDSVLDGNAILGHLLGSKDTSRRVAQHASQSTGVDNGIVKQMLPLIATMVMGAMSKQTSGGSMLAGLAGGSGDGAPDMLSALLDADGDGSVADDLLGIASKFLR